MSNILSNPEEFEQELTLEEEKEQTAIEFVDYIREQNYTRVKEKNSEAYGQYVQNRPRLAEACFYTLRELYRKFKTEQDA